MSRETARVLELTHRIDRWLLDAGVRNARRRASVAVDIADFLAAAAIVRRNVNRLLALDPANGSDAERGLRIATEIEAWLFTEMKNHASSLERDWPMVVGTLARTSSLVGGRGSKKERKP